MQPHLNKLFRNFSHRQRGASNLGVLLVLLVLFIGAAYAAFSRQAIYDWVKLRNYDPSAQVSQLATEGAFSPYATKIFYVNHPELQNKQAFIVSCPASLKEQTIVLGCYHGNQQGIFLLDVADERLNGVEQVTAAHEMLHAAYDRLSRSERTRVDGMLLRYYKTGLKDERVKSTIDAYRKTEPNDLLNEMHSIFATEIADLPKELDTYYKQFFSNRGQVVRYAERYQREFSSRHKAVEKADAQLAAVKAQIEDAQADLRNHQAEIERRRAALVAARDQNNVAAYNAGVPAYNALVDDYNVKVRSLQSLISQYNNLVNQRNAIAVEEGQLIDELKTNVDTIHE
jgi:hypothetical protein